MNSCFISIEGLEGAGKSTVIAFIETYLKQQQIDVMITREPGGTEIAEKIRRILLDHHQETMTPYTELLLYFAGRAQHLSQVIRPALQQGKWVLCDRFTDASYAYQGAGRGIPSTDIAVLEQMVQGDMRPDLTLFFDVDVEVGLQRIQKNRVLDRFEVEEVSFFQRIRECYLNRAQSEPQRFKIINANLPIAQVEAQVIKVLDSLSKLYLFR